MDLLAPRELEPGSTQGLNEMFLILQFDEDGHDDLASVNSGYSPGASQGYHTYLSGASTKIRDRKTSTKLFLRSPRTTMLASGTCAPKEAAVCSHCSPFFSWRGCPKEPKLSLRILLNNEPFTSHSGYALRAAFLGRTAENVTHIYYQRTL